MTTKRKWRRKIIRVRTLADVCDDPPKRLGLRTFRDEGFFQHHAGDIMHVMSLWTRIDVEVQRLLLPLMTAEHSLVARMISSTRNSDAAIRAAARERLAPDRLELVTKLLGDIQRIRSRRNVYAHWVAAYSNAPGVADKVLFIDPSHLAAVHADVHADPASTWVDEQFPETDPRFVLVYDESDFAEDRHMAASALAALRLLRAYLSEPPGTEIPEALSRQQRSLEILEFPPHSKV